MKTPAKHSLVTLLIIAVVLFVAFNLQPFPLERYAQDLLRSCVHVQACFHGGERKWRIFTFIVLSVALLAGGERSLRIELTRHLTLLAFLALLTSLAQCVDPLRVAFKRGILHPKLCGKSFSAFLNDALF